MGQVLVTAEDAVRERSEVDLAWAAGLFIGEGCVTVTRTYNQSGVYPYLKVDIRMYDERAIARFREITGAGYTLTHPRGKRPVHCARAVGRSAERILAMLWPYIQDTEKGDQALDWAKKLGVEDWITGVEAGERPQPNARPRGRRSRR